MANYGKIALRPMTVRTMVLKEGFRYKKGGQIVQAKPKPKKKRK